MGSSFAGGEMCMDSGRRRGGKKAAADHQKANKQPQRGLGVAQLEKIRLHNQMMAAYRHHQDAGTRQVPFAAAPVAGASSSFQQPAAYLTPFNLQNCFEETERGIVAVHYYDGHLPPYGSSPPPPSLFAHDVRDSSGHRLGQPQHQQHYWICSPSEGSRSGGSGEELDLELRL
ncbi:hypothetical protein SEVIR_5G007700v4 [Setaria viridis]|uniref:Uncharacterized protein n=3 Tax=Setaria TaxID=4554 RepID=A0A368QZX7_SETIT|nr:uncharacterized protein LOC117858545 isoform X1 [Setaria viridis]RCV23462.1 hypothetical protein SETIT_5G007900v2 [Setaria italica]